MGNLLGSFFSWLMPTITAWFVGFMGRKMIVATTTVATFVLISAAFIVCIKQILDSLMLLAVLPPWLIQGVGMFIPGDFFVCLGAILSSYSCRWAYDKAIDKVRMINGAT